MFTSVLCLSSTCMLLCNGSLQFWCFISDQSMNLLESYNRYCFAVSLLSVAVIGLVCVVVLSSVKLRVRVCFVLYRGLPVTAQSSTTNCSQTSLKFGWTPSAITSGEKNKKKTTFLHFAYHSNRNPLWLIPPGSL